MVVLLQSAPSRRNLKGCTHRQVERYHHAGAGLYLSARGVHGEEPHRVHVDWGRVIADGAVRSVNGEHEKNGVAMCHYGHHFFGMCKESRCQKHDRW